MEQYRTATYEYGNIEIVVHRPVLDDKERKKREDALLRAVTAYGKRTMNQRSEADAVHG